MLDSINELILIIIIFILTIIFIKQLIKNKNSKITAIYWLSLIISLLFLVVVTTYNIKSTTKNIIILFQTIIILIVGITSYKQASKNKKLVIKYDCLLEFLKKYEIEIDNQRTLHHETKNELLTIKSKLIDNDNYQNVLEYVNEIIKENNHKINTAEYSKLRYLPSNGIKGLIYFKVRKALDSKINIDINIAKKIETSHLCNLNTNTFNQLVKLLGIFLDNAIEASSISLKKNLGIEIYLEDNNILFIISNTYKHLPNKLHSNISTKDPSRGHGLILAKNIISLNPKFKHETIITENIYVQKLIVKK